MVKSQSCSACWEDFTEGEEVKLLECEHCFHAPCIIRWLELHGTCPVCRKELGKNGQAPRAEGEAGAEAEPEVAAAGGEAESSASSSSSSSNTQDSAHVSTSPGGTTTQSVSVSGTGGLTGLIQSALNQVFNANW